MGAAVYLWNTGRFDVYHVNPPLVRAIAGLPVVLCDPEYDWRYYSPIPANRCEWHLGVDFVEENSPTQVHWYFFVARCACVPLVLLGAYAGYRFAVELYGTASGIIFLLLWVFSPTILAWGATICPDVAAASTGTLGLYSFWKWLKAPSWLNAIVAGAFLGLMPLTKLTWIVAFVLWPLIWCVWRLWPTREDRHECERVTKDRKTRTGLIESSVQMAVILLTALYILNLGYGLGGTFRPLREYEFSSTRLAGHSPGDNGDNVSGSVGNRFSKSKLGYLPVPLPKELVQGIDTQAVDFERGRESYLRGEYSDRGWWYYYAYAILVKEPLGTLAMLVMSMFVSGHLSSEGKRFRREEVVVVLAFVGLFAFASSQSGFSLHSRYVIPALPFLYIVISRVGMAFERASHQGRAAVPRVTQVLVILSIGWTIVSSMTIYPHCMSYFNELALVLPTPHDSEYPKPLSGEDARATARAWAGPLHGPRHLLCSNIEWGQDLPYLKRWLDNHPHARPMRIAYWSSYPLRLSEIESAGPPPSGPEGDENTAPESVGPVPGWYALSVNEIYGRDKRYHYFLHFEPIATAGYSIYIYHIPLEDANRVRDKLGLPELPEDYKEAPERPQQ